ncbi:MAG: dihydroorotase [Flavobacteriales bacterium]|nr:dihydroorotase [Flavobacteriales bacterium]MDG1780870.1 dihydroorotase [Flavobacteriales bacterium]MDG2246705.1 dihydroorotase [Flavobacteriales bacterium]
MSTLFKNVTLINEGTVRKAHVLVRDQRIQTVDFSCTIEPPVKQTVEGEGKYLMAGAIDDQVHFREPGLTHKAEIATESRAAVAGGITSFMEMPNTVPNALTQELLQDKYDRAAEVSPANYSFFMGASNENIKDVLKTDPKTVCGVKIFMGSSTGNMLVDDRTVLEGIFSECPMLIATHCEDEATIQANIAKAKATYGENVPMSQHPYIRSEEACYKSSSLAVELATKYNTRLHILHISTAKELSLFRNDIPLEEKRITAEACIHHLWFSEENYIEKGTHIKWNPAVKKKSDRAAIREALLDGRIDVVATDHAPHTLQEKSGTYFNAPSGGPLVQHSVVAMLALADQGVIELTDVPRLMAHDVARCFQLAERGYVREGYYADLVLIDPSTSWTVSKSNILYKCGWSPFEGTAFENKVAGTWVNGEQVYDGERVTDNPVGKRLTFDR